MLIELAIGDAYGAAFEYVPAEHTAKFHTMTAYARHPQHALAPGTYTDDTQMSVAVAEVLLGEPPWGEAAFAESFVRAFQRDPRKGYARGFQKFLEETEDVHTFLRDIRPDSDKSGAAMRACPIGLLETISRVVEVASLQARVTHDTRDGVDAAVAAALSAHYFAYRLGPPEELGAFLVETVGGPWGAPWVGEVGAQGWMSVRAAVTAIGRNRSLTSLLRACVDFGGDVDTVAAVALGAASMSEDYARDLPEALVVGLENGPFGRDFLGALDRRLLAHFGFEPRG